MPGEPSEQIQTAVTALSSADRTAVVAALRASAPGLYQAIFQEGHNIGYGQRHGELDTLSIRASTAETKLADVTRQLTEARTAGPVDVTKLHSDYQKQLDDAARAAATEKSDLLGRLSDLSLRTAQSELRATLTSLGVDPDYAAVLTEKPETRQRMKVADEKITILQSGTEIPVVASNGHSPIQILADELHAKVPAKFIVSRVDAGAGDGAGAGGAGSMPGGDRNPQVAALDKVIADKRAELDKQRKDREASAPVLASMGFGASAAS